jgi:hypothetical protein
MKFIDTIKIPVIRSENAMINILTTRDIFIASDRE